MATKDGVLVVRHENEIDHHRRGLASRVRLPPHDHSRRRSLSGWFTEDFTLAELRTLHAEGWTARSPEGLGFEARLFFFGGLLVSSKSRVLGGFMMNDITPGSTRSACPAQAPVLPRARTGAREQATAHAAAQRPAPARLARPSSPSRPTACSASTATRLPLVQLLGALQVPTDPASLRGIARYADGVGPAKDYVVALEPDGSSSRPTGFVRRAHRAGLRVHGNAFRRENAFLPAELRRGTDPAAYGNIAAEYEQFLDLGVDGLFADQPDSAVRPAPPRSVVLTERVRWRGIAL